MTDLFDDFFYSVELRGFGIARFFAHLIELRGFGITDEEDFSPAYPYLLEERF